MAALPSSDAAARAAAIAAWVDALRRGADADALRGLPPLDPADASRVMAVLRGDDGPEPRTTTPPAPALTPAEAPPVAARLRPRLTLQTLTRGDGLLGLQPGGVFGPRGATVTVAEVDWAYTTADGTRWETPAPTSVLNSRPPATVELPGRGGAPLTLQRDRAAEADALDDIRATGLHPLAADALQWRSPEAAAGRPPLWSLAQEEFFGAFWAEQVPRLQSRGWLIRVRPGFAHETLAVQAWRLVLSPATGEVLAKEPAQPLQAPGPALGALGLPPREGSWMLSLGIEVDGQTLDLAPLLADLLRRDGRWLDAATVAAFDDAALVRLFTPDGRVIDTRAAPIKAVVGSLLDLLTDPRRRDGPLHLGAWEAHRLEALRWSLMDTEQRAAREGESSAWQLQGDAGLRALAERLGEAGGPRPVPAPAGLGITLRPYQLHGLAWLQYLRQQRLAGILADDMGLGKTAQVLAHVLAEKLAGRLDGPVLVVLPTTLVFNWQAEAQRVAPALRVLALQGPERAADFARVGEHDLVLTTFALVWRDLDALRRVAFDTVVLDEAQWVKNAASRAAAAVRRLNARHRLCLTGTPLENHLGELWAQFDFLLPGFLGDARSFRRLWRKPIEENGETLRAQLLAQRVRPFILRRSKAEVAAELPPRTEVVKRLQLQGRQRELYESVRVAADEQVRRLLQRRGFKGAQIGILDALLKLRQVCCDPWLVKGRKTPKTMERAKLELLRDMLPALVAEGRRVLVFSQFTEMLALIADELVAVSLPFLSLTGATSGARRGGRVDAFQRGEAPVLLASLKAGGVGLNLTAADTVIHVDPWWNPAVQEQATARAHRIGQERAVFVYRLVIEGSIEERMLELQARKQRLADGVLGRDAGDAAKFSAQDLQALLAPLGPPPVLSAGDAPRVFPRAAAVAGASGLRTMPPPHTPTP